MRTLLIILSFFLYFNSFAQKISTTNVVGKWKSVAKQNDPVFTFEFSDSIYVYVYVDGNKLPKQGYSIDTSANLAVIDIKTLSPSGKVEVGRFIFKYIDQNTLKIQFPLDVTAKPIWEKETSANTGVLKKVK